MQQTNFPIEIIINDDCSTDGTTEIIREYAAKYPEIIFPVFHEKNLHVNDPFQRFVFPKARGKYIAMCEGDDYWTNPLKLQKQVDFLESHPDYSMCFHKAKVIVQDGREYIDYFSKLEEREYQPEEVLTKWIIPTASILFRSTVHIPTHKDFIVGDLIIHAACVTRGKVYCLNREMSVYRLHGAGWSARDYNYFEHIIKGLPSRLAMLETFPRSKMKPLKKLIAFRCYLWLREYWQHRGLIPRRYVFKAFRYCNWTLLYFFFRIPINKLLRKVGFSVKSSPE